MLHFLTLSIATTLSVHYRYHNANLTFWLLVGLVSAVQAASCSAVLLSRQGVEHSCSVTPFVAQVLLPREQSVKCFDI
jgi:hypothetical protein